MMFNDRSVLEMMHASLTSELIDRLGLLQGLTEDESRYFRRSLVDAILKTDMALHGDLLATVKGRLAEVKSSSDVSACNNHQATSSSSASSSSSPLDLENSESDRRLMTSTLLHAADLSTPLMPFDMSVRLARALYTEFKAQRDLEEQKQLPLTAMVATDDADMSKKEIGFLKFVVRPLFVVVSDLCPELEYTVGRIDDNLKVWEGLSMLDSTA